MADSSFINVKYTQQGSICVLACYGIIIEYFSDNNFLISKLFNQYFRNNNLKGKYTKDRENAISECYHNYCRPKSMRGFEFICEYHNNNIFKTQSYCNIIGTKAQTTVLTQQDITDIENLITNNIDSLAMILYQVNASALHAVVIGYDEEEQKYFLRDPEKKDIEFYHTFQDIINGKSITEYIVFEDI